MLNPNVWLDQELQVFRNGSWMIRSILGVMQAVANSPISYQKK